MIRVGGALLIGALVSGCATTSPRAGLSEVDRRVTERVGASPRLEEKTRAPVNLDGIIGVDRAVAIALAHNATLRGRVEELGIAQAELAQAALITNPRAHASFRFPAGGGAEETGNEIGVDMEILDVITRPVRKRMAARQFEQAKLRLAHDILKLAVDVKAAFYAYQATLERLELRRVVVENMEAASELSRRQHEAGNVTALDLANHRAEWQDATVELRHDETEAAVDLEKLALLMGVQDQGPITVERKLPPVHGGDPDPGKLEEMAMARRWDLAAARREPGVLNDALKLSKLNIFSGLELGVDSEKDSDGAKGVGPDASVPLPVFDRRGPANAKVRAQIAQAKHTLTALEQEVRYEVRAAWRQLKAARQDAATYRTSLLPLRREVVEETLKRYNFMLEGVYELLDVKRKELDAQRAYIDAQKRYWTQWAQLERAVGGRVPSELVPPPGKADEPAPAAPDHQHHHGGE